jgi:isopentenyl diphosphate isomerase/L-lactate dehydrogenase-like FMN-dependent dehydrogenase
MYEGLDGRYNPPQATWEYVGRLKKLTRMKVFLKGLDSAEDAKLAVEHGADGIIVSNHGGRAADTLRGTIDCLPEVVTAVNGKIPVFVDGGFRHGTDVYKALASGAKAVGIVRAELTLTMRQMGTPSVREITSARILRA